MHSVAGVAMDAEQLRAMANRCRELQRRHLREDARQLLRQWAKDLDAEAETLEQRTENRESD